MAKLNAKQLQKAHAALINDARQRVADRGVLQFRADPELVLAVMDAADRQNLPVGAMLRQWVQEKLMLDSVAQNAPTLIERVAVLEEAVTDLRQKLNP